MDTISDDCCTVSLVCMKGLRCHLEEGAWIDVPGKKIEHTKHVMASLKTSFSKGIFLFF
jgi:hypothetical protein